MAAATPPTVAGFAIVGRSNKPLFVRSFGSEDHLKFQFVVHTSLDIVDERGACLASLKALERRAMQDSEV